MGDVAQMEVTAKGTPDAAPVKAAIGLKNLKHALKVIGMAIERTATLPILQCVRMEQIKLGFALESTNLEIFIRAIVDELGGPQQPILTPAEKFTGWTKLLAGDDVKISATDKRATVQCGRSRVTLPVMPAANWPNNDVFGMEKPGVILTQGSFARALRFALISISNDASRYTLNGIQAVGDGKKLQLVSTNGHCLTVYTLECEEKINILLPGGLVKAMLPLLTEEDGGVELFVNDSIILADIDADMRIFVASKMLTGQFPNWEAAYPKDERTEITAKVPELLASLERCILLSDERSCAVDLTFADQITLDAASTMNGEARETVECQGAPPNELHIRLNGEYLLNLLKKLDGEIRIALPAKSDRPLLLKATPHEDETVDYLIMPMMRSND